MIFKNHYTYC